MAATYSPSMAPRYVPKRGQVLKKSLKKIVGLCTVIRASPIHHCDKQGFLQFDMAATYSPSMAPRYVPKRGQVLKKSLKKIVGLCTVIRASPIHHCDKQGFLQFDMAATYSPSMAPRYVPKRGQVLKKSLKKIVGLCTGIRASPIHHCDKQGFLQFDMAATYSPSMAPRYVPKRGQVLKKSLKKIFGLCIGIRASRIHHCDQQGFLSN